MDISKLSGLEQLKLLLEGNFPPPSMATTMGFALKEVEEGFCRGEAIPDERHLNPTGSVHGGFVATVLDSVTGIVTHTVLPGGVAYGTIDLHVKMLRPPKIGKTYTAEGHILNISRNLVASHGKIMDEEGKLVAYGSATCMIIRGDK